MPAWPARRGPSLTPASRLQLPCAGGAPRARRGGAYLGGPFLLEADDVQVEVLPRAVGSVEGDAPGQAVPPSLRERGGPLARGSPPHAILPASSRPPPPLGARLRRGAVSPLRAGTPEPHSAPCKWRAFIRRLHRPDLRQLCDSGGPGGPHVPQSELSHHLPGDHAGPGRSQHPATSQSKALAKNSPVGVLSIFLRGKTLIR